MKQPRIQVAMGKTPSVSYEEALRSLGAEPVSAYAPKPDLSCDALLLTGGGDVDPAFFHQPLDGSEDIDRVRDEAELALFQAFYQAGKPIMGVCRGHQVINIALGGGLIQHIGDTLCIFHRHSDDHEGDKTHAVRAEAGSWYEQTYGKVFTVNSSHHQALGELGKGLRSVLWSESGIIEAVEHESAPIVSVQFHPERMMLKYYRPLAVDGTAVFERFMEMIRRG